MKPDNNEEPEAQQDTPEEESLADQALESIVRSQQLRERARRLREKPTDKEPAP